MEAWWKHEYHANEVKHFNKLESSIPVVLDFNLTKAFLNPPAHKVKYKNK